MAIAAQSAPDLAPAVSLVLVTALVSAGTPAGAGLPAVVLPAAATAFAGGIAPLFTTAMIRIPVVVMHVKSPTNTSRSTA